MCKYFSFKDYHDLFHNHDTIYFYLISYNIWSFSANNKTMFNSMNLFPDILVFTETWLRSENIQFSNGCNGYHTIRSIRRSGGVSLYVKDYISSQIKINLYN